MQEAQPDLIKTGMKLLKPFFEQHPVLALIEEYFKLLDLIGKFANPMLFWSERSGRLHPGYNIGGKANVKDAAGTVTSRLSSKDPNVMNYPPEILPCIVSRFEGGKILQRDFGQLELRVMAQAGDDDVFKAEFQKADADPHQATADAAGCDRASGKVLNFMIAYGGGISKIMAELGCDKKTAERLLAMFWQAHPKLRIMFARWRMEASSRGVISGLFGQDLHTPDAKDNDQKVRSHAFRRSGNFPIQNGGALITLRCMWRIEWEMQKRGLKSLLIAQLHDALYVDVYPGEEEEVDALMAEIMEKDVPTLWKWWEVPLGSDSKIGYNMAGSQMRVAA